MHLQIKAARLSAFFSRFLALSLAAVLVLPCMVPASYADYSSEGDAYRNGSMWDSLMFMAYEVGSTTDWGGLVHLVTGKLSGKVCPRSSDAYHHSHVIGDVGGVDGNGQRYVICTCSYCGDAFRVYEGDFRYSYLETTRVMGEDLGTTVIADGGAVFWSPVHDYTVVYTNEDWTEGIYCRHHDAGVNPFSVTFNCSDYDTGVRAVPAPGKSTFTCYGINFCYTFAAPFTGQYQEMWAPRFEYTVRQPDRFPQSGDSYWGKAGNYDPPANQYREGETVSVNNRFSLSSNTVQGAVPITEYESVDVAAYAPVYRVIPNDYDKLLADYGKDSRPGNFPAYYGILDGDTLVPVDTRYIVNESAMTLTNPVCDRTWKIASWSYDYATRTYDLLYEGGSMASVTYGDTAVTIEEDGLTFTVYYLVPGSNFAPGVHTHDWTAMVTNSASCTAPGSVTYTCSGCTETMSETIDALGHDWQVKEELSDSTLYECSRCQETTEEETGTQPGPGDGSGSSPGDGDEEGGGIWDKLVELIGVVFDGIIGIIERVAQKLFDALHALIDLVTGGFSAVVDSVLSIFIDVPGMFGRFLDFLTSVFSLIPHEVVTLMKFSIMAAVLVGVIKAVRR